jgi:hypothetical protein
MSRWGGDNMKNTWAVAAAILAAGCGKLSNRHFVGGTVTGLTGTGLVLQNDGQDDLVSDPPGGEFTFRTTVAEGARYDVTVKSQPTSPAQTCTVSQGAGTMGKARVTDVQVQCTTSHSIGGTVSGLVGTGLVLQNNQGDDLPVAPPGGSFTFGAPLDEGRDYAVTVGRQPASPAQTCHVEPATATGKMGDSNVTSVAVTCEIPRFTVRGTVSGLLGSGLVLRNGDEDLPITREGEFAFTELVTFGEPYEVTVQAPPRDPPQLCTPMNSRGVMGAQDVVDVHVHCSTLAYRVGGTVSGLRGSGLVLRNNGGDDHTLAADGPFRFDTLIASGATYDVTVHAQPVSASQPVQLCTVTRASGSVSDGDVTDVSVTCRVWGSPQPIGVEPTVRTRLDLSSSSLALALDPRGNAIALWVRNGAPYNIWANSYQPRSGWSVAEAIETESAGDTTYSLGFAPPQIAFDSAGNSVAVWLQHGSTGYLIGANRYAGGSWGEAQPIEEGDVGRDAQPQVAVDQAGDAIAVWNRTSGSTRSIWANRYTSGGNWGDLQSVETNTSAFYQQIATDPTGNMTVVWRQGDGLAPSDIYANRYVPGTGPGSGWGTPEPIEASELGEVYFPDMAVNSVGNAVVAWQERDSPDFSTGYMNIRANVYTPGSGWGDSRIIETKATADAEHYPAAFYPQVAVDSSGNGIVVWQQWDSSSGRYDIWANHYVAADDSWGTAVPIGFGYEVADASYPQVAFDPAGNAIAVWQGPGSDGFAHVWANRYVTGAGWGAQPQRIATGSEPEAAA